MWMMPLHLHVNQKSDYDDDMMITLSMVHNTERKATLSMSYHHSDVAHHSNGVPFSLT